MMGIKNPSNGVGTMQKDDIKCINPEFISQQPEVLTQGQLLPAKTAVTAGPCRQEGLSVILDPEAK